MLRSAPLVLLVACSGPTAVDAGTAVTLTTFAGANGAAGSWADGPAGLARFNFPEGLALDASGSRLLVADAANHVIREVDLATGAVRTLAGTPGKAGYAESDADGGAQLSLPRNLVLAPGGRSVYFTDTGNSVVRSLELEMGRVTTEFGSVGAPGTADGVGVRAQFGRKGFFSVQPWGGGLALDGAERLYVADSANQTIRAINLSTREVTTLAGVAGVAGARDGPALTATFNKPSGLVVSGRALFITEANNLTIRRLDLTTREVTTVAGKAPSDPGHYCEEGSPVLPPECGATDSVDGQQARFRFPFGVAEDGKGGFFVVDSHNNLIRHFEVGTTAVSTVAGAQLTVLDDFERPSEDTGPGPGTFSHPSHAVFVAPHTLYVADRSANCIRRVELAH